MQPARSLAPVIDATFLRPQASIDEVGVFVEQAAKLGCAAAVVFPLWCAEAAQILKSTGTRLCVTSAFPAGAVPPQFSVKEVEEVLEMGAQEIDWVMPLGLVRSGRQGEVVELIGELAHLIHADGGRVLKVIVESGVLERRDLVRAVRLVADGGADFVKTSSGVYGSGATPAVVRLYREAAGSSLAVKAAGGVQTREVAVDLIEAGAARIGTSQFAKILDDTPSGATRASI